MWWCTKMHKYEVWHQLHCCDFLYLSSIHCILGVVVCISFALLLHLCCTYLSCICVLLMTWLLILAPELHFFFWCICFAFVSYFVGCWRDDSWSGRWPCVESVGPRRRLGRLVVGGPSFFHLLDGWEAFLSQLGFRFGFEPGNGWSERRYWVVKRAFQEHGQPGFQRRWVQVIHCFHDKSMTGYQKCCVFVANDNENQKKCIFTERWRTLRP